MNNKIVISGLAIAIVGAITVSYFNNAPPEESIVELPAPAIEQPMAIIRDEGDDVNVAVPDAGEALMNAKPVTPEPLPDIVTAPAQLAQSDAQVLLAAADLAQPLVQWLLPKEQLRKWVLAIDLMADGQLPKRYRPIDFPIAQFAVQQSGQATVAKTSNFARMDELIETVMNIPPKKLARYYQQWLPLLEQAYQEQGKATSFDQRFKQTISQILAAPSLTQNPVLKRPSVLYRFADKDLEQASDVDKFLWRVGPDNAERIQNFVRELRYAIEA